MDLNDSIQQIAKRYFDTKEYITTEEATKTSLIMPFIQALGYETSNPLEVIPEYDAVITGKKGDKVDYVIKKNGEVIILMECKWHGQQLDINQEAQLMRYFQAISSKKIAILTNGVQYKFYTDLDEKNKMDRKPFLQFDITLPNNDIIIKELQRYAKTTFNIEAIMPAATELKYTGTIKKFLSDSLIEPHDDFVRTLATQAYTGKFTEKVKEKFKDIVKKAFNQFVSERISDRLSSALQEERSSANAKEAETIFPEEIDDKDNRIVTTQDEIDGYNIIRAILRKTVDVKRIAIRDAVGYCGILLDDSNQKKICRFFFNNSEDLSISLFDVDKKESTYPLTDIDDIYSLTDEIIKNVMAIDRKNSRKSAIGDATMDDGKGAKGALENTIE